MACLPHTPNESSRDDAVRPAVAFWRSLDELAASGDIAAGLRDEFPRHVAAWDPQTDRRRFLEIMASSLALAGMSGCSSPPPETIVPYVREPRGKVQGVPMQFATALHRAEGALGVVVESHMGRPTKIEGNPLHPASLGATDAQVQAEVLTLYDPDRSQTVRRGGEIATWDEFLGFVAERFPERHTGAGLRVLSCRSSSPTFQRQREAFLTRFRQAVWHVDEPLGSRAALAGAELAFERRLTPVYDLAAADVIVSLDADFLSGGSGAVRLSREFAGRRDPQAEGGFNRLYVLESTHTSTGAAADHRARLTPTQVERAARVLATRLGVEDAGGEGAEIVDADESLARILDAIIHDLTRARGRGLVLAGDHHPPELHALAYRMNAALANIGGTIQFIAPPDEMAADAGSQAELVGAINEGDVDALLLLDSNPVYTAPPGLEFAAALAKVPHAIHFGLYDDETATHCRWHIPATHDLESWSDVRAYDGTASIVQPLIAPLYAGKTIHELLSAFADPVPRASYDIVRETWQSEFGGDFERRWHRALSDGVIADSQFAVQTAELVAAPASSLPAVVGSDGDDRLELVLLPDPSVGDGRLANNAWLQELPKPLTKLTWENAVLVSPGDAARRGFTTGDVVRVAWEGRTIEGPVCILPGQPRGSVTCHLGYGRQRAGRVANGIGFNAYQLRGAESGFVAGAVTLTRTGRRVELAQTQKHFAIDDRNIVHDATVAEYLADPESVLPAALHHELPSLYPEDEYDRFAWGMSIDLSKCTGCNACVVACQAENNIPVVGKQRVIESREMHWLRIDTYFSGEPDNPAATHQPMLCQHCEKAPCEVVCPVAATTHSDEGLNEMTYNRCIGTRYCSNNCPYKVRRFNFFDYTGDAPAVVELARNPDVTVRSRGVMEKCTYCVQRINRARIEAKKQAVDEDLSELTIVDGSLQTACQQACPAQAIVFGDLNDASSRAHRLKADPRNYGVLSELGTQPRTTYLARLRNPHPDLA